MASATASVTRDERGHYTFAECEEYLVIDATIDTTTKNQDKEKSEKIKRPEETPSPTHAAVPPKQKRATRKRVACEDNSDTECSREKYSRQRSPDTQQQLTDEENEEWCMIDSLEARPAALYGCRLVEYDDREAEGNIHITDDDL